MVHFRTHNDQLKTKRLNNPLEAVALGKGLHIRPHITRLGFYTQQDKKNEYFTAARPNEYWFYNLCNTSHFKSIFMYDNVPKKSDIILLTSIL